MKLYRLRTFLRNVWRYRTWLSYDQDYDWEYLAEVMSLKLRFMSKHFTEHQFVEKADAVAAETLEAAETIDRLRDEMGYAYSRGYGLYEEMTQQRRRALWDAVQRDEEADEKRFSELMRNMRTWWD